MDLLERILKVKTTECDNCGEDIPIDKGFLNGLKFRSEEELAESNFMQVTNGLCVFGLGGYYGGFNDTMRDDTVVLCHDCSRLVYEALPGVAKQLTKDSTGLHPFEGDRCCEYGWTAIRDKDGNWNGETEGMTYDNS